MSSMPHLSRINGKTMLMVDDQPYIMLAGEAHNSSSSSLPYMEAVWEKAEVLGMNTVLLPVTWEMIEPEEGYFDFSLVKGLIDQARQRSMRIGILWFGAWKNAQCYYAPSWVKTDPIRFPRAEIIKGKHFILLEDFYQMPYSTLSYLGEETCLADARAFAKLMAFLREYDGKCHTVLTVQVENETGIMGAAREHSDAADALFDAPVPSEFAAYMHEHTASMAPDVRQVVLEGKEAGSWSEIFGSVAEEIFSAYYVSRYVGQVARAGKTEYGLPMTVNCWLNKTGESAGMYPSGGPVSRMTEVWRFCAPEIDIISPDIYVPHFADVCAEYTRRENPLYIPECATHSYAASRALFSIGKYHAICYAPFGFEDIGLPMNGAQMALFGADATDPALVTPQEAERYGRMNHLLSGMMGKLTNAYGSENLKAAICEEEQQATLKFGNFGIRVSFSAPDGACLALEDEEFIYILAQSSAISFVSISKDLPGIDILLLEEGSFCQNVWRAERRLNGDEAVVCACDGPTLYRTKLYVYC